MVSVVLNRLFHRINFDKYVIHSFIRSLRQVTFFRSVAKILNGGLHDRTGTIGGPLERPRRELVGVPLFAAKQNALVGATTQRKYLTFVILVK